MSGTSELNTPVRWVARKDIDSDRVAELLHPCLLTNQFTNGGCLSSLLESSIKNIVSAGFEHSVVVTSSGHAALYALSAAIASVRGKMKWAVPAFTFPASAQLAGEAVIVDIDMALGGPDLSSIPPDVNGLVVTNPFGYAAHISEYTDYCKRHNLALIFDNAAAPFTTYDNKNASLFGDGAIISFHHTKPIGFGEGGAVIVPHHLVSAVRRFINFGIGAQHEKWSPLGFNGKMSEVSAAYILQFLEKHRSSIRQHHSDAFNHVQGLLDDNITMLPSHATQTTPACICLITKNPSAHIIDKLNNSGVEARRYYFPLADLPKASHLWSHIICIPCHVGVSLERLTEIVDFIKLCHGN